MAGQGQVGDDIDHFQFDLDTLIQARGAPPYSTNRLARLLSPDTAGRPLYAYICPDGNGPFNGRLVQKGFEGRDLWAAVPCVPGSSSSSSAGGGTGTPAHGAFRGADGSSASGSSDANAGYRMARLLNTEVEGRPLYAADEPCCPTASDSSASQSSSSSSGSSESSSSGESLAASSSGRVSGSGSRSQSHSARSRSIGRYFFATGGACCLNDAWYPVELLISYHIIQGTCTSFNDWSFLLPIVTAGSLPFWRNVNVATPPVPPFNSGCTLCISVLCSSPDTANANCANGFINSCNVGAVLNAFFQCPIGNPTEDNYVPYYMQMDVDLSQCPVPCGGCLLPPPAPIVRIIATEAP
jgi:hypothetical protein